MNFLFRLVCVMQFHNTSIFEYLNWYHTDQKKNSFYIIKMWIVLFSVLYVIFICIIKIKIFCQVVFYECILWVSLEKFFRFWKVLFVHILRCWFKKIFAFGSKLIRIEVAYFIFTYYTFSLQSDHGFSNCVNCNLKS